MAQTIEITVRLYHPSVPTRPEDNTTGPELRGSVARPLISSDADNEENAVRLAEQMVRDAFRRAREKSDG